MMSKFKCVCIGVAFWWAVVYMAFAHERDVFCVGEISKDCALLQEKVGEVLGQPITRLYYAPDVYCPLNACSSDLNALLMPILLENFKKEVSFDIAPEQISAYIQYVRKLRVLDCQQSEAQHTHGSCELDTGPFEPEEAQSAIKHIQNWQMEKTLYERYQGRVIDRPLHLHEPIGAYFSFLKECLEKGELVFSTKTIEAQFLQPYLRDYPKTYRLNQIDFEHPWWQKDKRLN